MQSQNTVYLWRSKNYVMSIRKIVLNFAHNRHIKEYDTVIVSAMDNYSSSPEYAAFNYPARKEQVSAFLRIRSYLDAVYRQTINGDYQEPSDHYYLRTIKEDVALINNLLWNYVPSDEFIHYSQTKRKMIVCCFNEIQLFNKELIEYHRMAM